MSSNRYTVEELVVEMRLEFAKFKAQAAETEKITNKLTERIEGVEKSSSSAGDEVKKLGNKTEKTSKQNESLIKTLSAVAKKAAGFLTAAGSSGALLKMANNAAKLNDQLAFMEKRLGLSARGIREMSNAASMLGGDAGAMASTMKSLNQGIQEMIIMGNDSVIPFFNALGIGVTDAAGKVRAMDDILLDMAGSFEGMNPQQAYAMASAMGLDDGTANALLQGRDAMQEMIDMQRTLYVSTQAELDASRELNKSQAFLSAQWESMRLMLGNMLIPVLSKVTKTVSGFFDYLQRNERTVKSVFEGLTFAIGILLIPMITKATMAMWALISPVAGVGAAVVALAGSFALLYNDYKTWANGGKSLFDWTDFAKFINGAEFSVQGLANGFAKLLTGYESWASAFDALFSWAKFNNLIDGGQLSISNLASAFKNLASGIIDSVPTLRMFAEIIDKLMSGDFSGAAKMAAKIPVSVFQTAVDAASWGAERIGGALDTAGGISPDGGGALAAVARSFSGFVKDRAGAAVGMLPEWARMDSGGGDMFSKYEKQFGLPAGMMEAVRQQETSGNQAYIDDPAKYHFGLNSEGRRIAPHTGRVSTAFGPFGLLDSTAKDPGWGVKPLQNKSIEEQSRFMAEYLAKRIELAGGSVAGGLAGYGEGSSYASSVMSRLNPTGAAKAFVRGGSVSGGVSGGAGGGNQNNISVQVNGLQVTTTANSLSMATSDGVAAATQHGLGVALDQVGAGL